MTPKNIRILGVPMDLGQSQRGVDMGPGAVRYAGLAAKLRELGHLVEDCGNIQVPVRDSLPDDMILPAITKACESIYQAARKSLEDKYIPLFLGGDHSLAIGTIGGVTDDQTTGVIWVDAHGDFNTPQTSPSQNIHGMVLSILTGTGHPELVDVGRPGAKINPKNIILLGVRDIDPLEKQRLKDSKVTIFTMRDIDEQGMSTIGKKAIKKLAHLGRIHVSIDMDCLDPQFSPGVGTPVEGGLTYRETQLLMEIIADSGLLSSVDIVEINPILGVHNQTAKIAVELAASLFGKSIL